MAAFDFPSSPSVNQTYTANGVTWKWNGTMWMRITGAGYLEKIEEGNSKIEVDDSGSGNITASVDGTEALRVDSSGRVLLGTTTVGDGSADNLTIADVGHCGMTIRSGTSSVGGIYLGDGTSGSDQYRGYIEYNHSNDYLRFGTVSSERLRIASDGKLSITGSTANMEYLRMGGNNDRGLRFSSSSGSSSVGVVHTINAPGDGGAQGEIALQTNSTERFRIKSDGKIGFNAANPPRDYCFHSGQADTNIQITNNTTGIDDSAGSLIQQDGNDLYIWNKENSFMSLGTNAVERVRITSAGDMGLGTASPSSDGGRTLEVYDATTPTLRLNHNNAYKSLFQLRGNDLEIRGSNGQLEFYTGNADGASSSLRGAITSAGHKWTHNGSIFHGSNDVTDFTDANRNSYNNVSIRAGDPNDGTSPTNDNSAIKIYPVGIRGTTTGTLSGGIAWQHLDLNNGDWGTRYGSGSQMWMGAAIHDVPGQERDRFNLWMNDQTSQGSNPNNLAIEAYPNGVVRHPKVPAFMVRNTTNSGAFSANSRATWNTTILNNGSHFDMTNNVFTAPVDGIYNFSCMMLSQNNTRLFHNFRVNNTIVEGTRSESYQGTSYQTNTITMVFSLSASDYVDVYVRNNAGYGGFYTNFNGFLVG